MTATLHPLHPPALVALWRASKNACGAFVHAARRRAGTWQRLRKARAALLELSTMSEHQLRDLGIDRSELRSIAMRPDDTTRRRLSA
jgi:uncharacterized protein YjiS (DUF1127 family)